MKTIAQAAEASIEVKRSKFLAHLVPMRDFETFREELKKAHPKAGHIAWAYRDLNGYDQVVEDFSDDGEPKGCAGLPILTRLRGEEMIGCGVLVVRYFGGIKLGTGGMARAYGEAAAHALRAAERVPFEKRKSLTFFTPFCDLGRWEYETARLAELSTEREFDGTGARWRIQGPESSVKTLAALLEKGRIDFSIE